MILFNEKQEGDLEGSKELPSCCTKSPSNRIKSSSLPDQGGEVGLLRRYLEQHRRQSEVPPTRCPSEQAILSKGMCAGSTWMSPSCTSKSESVAWLEDLPPPWSPPARRLRESPDCYHRQASSPSPPIPTHDAPHAVKTADDNIQGVWILPGDDAAVVEGVGSGSQSSYGSDTLKSNSSRVTRVGSRPVPRNLHLETMNGNINARLVLRGGCRPCRVEMLAEHGSIDATAVSLRCRSS